MSGFPDLGGSIAGWLRRQEKLFRLRNRMQKAPKSCNNYSTSLAATVELQDECAWTSIGCPQIVPLPQQLFLLQTGLRDWGPLEHPGTVHYHSRSVGPHVIIINYLWLRNCTTDGLHHRLIISLAFAIHLSASPAELPQLDPGHPSHLPKTSRRQAKKCSDASVSKHLCKHLNICI